MIPRQRGSASCSPEKVSRQVSCWPPPDVNLHRSSSGVGFVESYSEIRCSGPTGALLPTSTSATSAHAASGPASSTMSRRIRDPRAPVPCGPPRAALRELYLCRRDLRRRFWPLANMGLHDANRIPAPKAGRRNNGCSSLNGVWTVYCCRLGTTKSAAPAANGGLDLVMPGPRGPWGDQLVAAVRSGAVAEATIDDHLARLLRLAGRVGALQGIPAERTAEIGPVVAADSPAMRLHLRNLASAGGGCSRPDILPLQVP